MNDYILIFIVAAYICVGVFVVVWMDRNYFDRKGENKSVAGWWWKMAIWPVLVPKSWLGGLARVCAAHGRSVTSSGRSNTSKTVRMLQ